MDVCSGPDLFMDRPSGEKKEKKIPSYTTVCFYGKTQGHEIIDSNYDNNYEAFPLITLGESVVIEPISDDKSDETIEKGEGNVVKAKLRVL